MLQNVNVLKLYRFLFKKARHFPHEAFKKRTDSDIKEMDSLVKETFDKPWFTKHLPKPEVPTSGR